MKFKERLLQGSLEKRYKRFFIDIKYKGKSITAHCPNTGSMLGLLDKNNKIWFSKSDNKKRNRSLMSKLKSKGYGLTQLKGTYPEGGKEAKEDSFFVVDLQETGDLLNDLKKLGAEFEQDSVLFVPKGAINGEGEKAFLLGTNNCPKGWPGMGKKDIFAGGKLGKTSKIYTSKVNGRPFLFETVLDEVYTPGSGYGWWSLHLAAAQHWSELEVDDD